MIVTTFFTETHEELYRNYLFPSVNLSPGDLFIAGYGEQLCPSGNYRSDGFGQTMQQKIRHLYSVAEQHPDEIILFADADVRFYCKNLKEEAIKGLGINHMAFQSDDRPSNPITFCAGLFVFRSSNRVRRFLKNVEEVCHNYPDDQDAINQLLVTPEWKHVSVGVLPRSWWTHGVENGLWEKGMPMYFDIPTDIVAHHANWTVGVENKKILLEHVISSVCCCPAGGII